MTGMCKHSCENNNGRSVGINVFSHRVIPALAQDRLSAGCSRRKTRRKQIPPVSMVFLDIQQPLCNCLPFFIKFIWRRMKINAIVFG